MAERRKWAYNIRRYTNKTKRKTQNYIQCFSLFCKHMCVMAETWACTISIKHFKHLLDDHRRAVNFMLGESGLWIFPIVHFCFHVKHNFRLSFRFIQLLKLNVDRKIKKSKNLCPGMKRRLCIDITLTRHLRYGTAHSSCKLGCVCIYPSIHPSLTIYKGNKYI